MPTEQEMVGERVEARKKRQAERDAAEAAAREPDARSAAQIVAAARQALEFAKQGADDYASRASSTQSPQVAP